MYTNLQSVERDEPLSAADRERRETLRELTDAGVNPLFALMVERAAGNLQITRIRPGAA